MPAVRTEVDRLVAEQTRRADNFDTKAGLLLGFCGVLIGFSSGDATVLLLLAKLSAAAAASFAVWALMPRISGGVKPRYLRETYLNEAESTTNLRLLDTRIWLYELDESRLTDKVKRLRIAVALLAIAVLLLLTASLVDALRGDGHETAHWDQWHDRAPAGPSVPPRPGPHR
jgi:hypothetical protein